ncbi:MAG: DUF4189 domain-containing protein [Gammaproteobacteria bacterium]|nr:DUF4189 domain-containing protein [Gammaproteobacteria bacterium]
MRKPWVTIALSGVLTLMGTVAVPIFPAQAGPYEQCLEGCGDAARACGGVGDDRDCSGPRLTASLNVAICEAQNNTGNTGPVRYGALAYSQTMQGWATASEWADRASAENAALDSCRSLAAAATDCQIAVWFYNTCGSIAAAPGAIFGSGYGNPTHVAEGYALQSCRQAGGGDSCVVQKAVCTGL